MSKIYWDLSDPTMADALRTIVRGRSVLELGGGAGELAKLMVKGMRAEKVLVVEKESDLRTEWERNPVSRVNFFWGYLQDFLQAPEFKNIIWGVVVISWPVNHLEFDIATIMAIRRAAQVVIIGKNDGCTACGTDVLWNRLIARERIRYVAGRHNDLVAYGLNPRSPAQKLVPIEEFGIRYSEETAFPVTVKRLSQAVNLHAQVSADLF